MQDDIKPPPESSQVSGAAQLASPPDAPISENQVAQSPESENVAQHPPTTEKSEQTPIHPTAQTPSHKNTQHIIPIILAVVILIFLAAAAVMSEMQKNS